jgi:hypothetical protein
MFTVQEHKETVQRDTFLDFFLNELIVGLSLAAIETLLKMVLNSGDVLTFQVQICSRYQ